MAPKRRDAISLFFFFFSLFLFLGGRWGVGLERGFRWEVSGREQRKMYSLIKAWKQADQQLGCYIST